MKISWFLIYIIKQKNKNHSLEKEKEKKKPNELQYKTDVLGKKTKQTNK